MAFFDSLKVTCYEAMSKEEKSIAIDAYRNDAESGYLLMKFGDRIPLDCSIGILSTGSFILLTTKKIKK